MKKLFTVLALLLALSTATFAQNTRVFVPAANFAKYTLTSTSTVAASSGQSVTIAGNGYVASTDGVVFTPIATTTLLHISGGGGADEDVTPATVSCPYNSGTCTFTATFGNAHTGMRITSSDAGLDEAMRASPSGTTVLALKTATMTLSGATTTATNFIPANSILYSFTAKVGTAITKSGGATTLWQLGSGTADKWGTTLALAAGTTINVSNYKSTTVMPGAYPAAESVIATATTDNFAGGTVLLTITFGKIVQ